MSPPHGPLSFQHLGSLGMRTKTDVLCIHVGRRVPDPGMSRGDLGALATVATEDGMSESFGGLRLAASSQYFPGRLDWHRREIGKMLRKKEEVGREEDRLSRRTQPQPRPT